MVSQSIYFKMELQSIKEIFPLSYMKYEKQFINNLINNMKRDDPYFDRLIKEDSRGVIYIYKESNQEPNDINNNYDGFGSWYVVLNEIFHKDLYKKRIDIILEKWQPFDYNKRYDLYYLFKWGQAIKTENKISDNIGIYKDGSIIPENLEKEYYTQAVYRYPGASKYIYTPEFTYSSTLKEAEDELLEHLILL